MPDTLVAPTDSAGAGDGNAALLEALTRCAGEWAETDAWAPYLDGLAQVEAAAGDAVHPVLLDVCVLVKSFVAELAERHERPDAAQRELLQCWPTLAAAFCEFPGDPETGNLLIAHLQDPRWPNPLPDEDAAMMRGFLDQAGPGPDAEGENGGDGDPALQDTWLDIESEPADGLDDTHPDGIAPPPESSDTALELPSVSSLDSLDPAAREMVTLLLTELEAMRDVLAETLTVACCSETAPEARREALGHYAEQVTRLGMAAEVGGLEGLSRVCALLERNLDSYARQDRSLGEAARRVLSVWLARVYTYLHDLGGAPACPDLLAVLADPAWPEPLAGDASKSLAALLSSPVTDALKDDRPPRQVTASPDDVSLDLPEDTAPELLEGLLQELPGQTAEFSAAVQKLAAGDGDAESIDVAQRIAHTLKGAANTVGIAGIANVTHHLEDILLVLARHDARPGAALAEVLVSAADCLEAMSEALLGQGPAPDDAVGALQQVLDWANRIDAEGVAAATAPAPAATADTPAAETRTPEPQPGDPPTQSDDTSAAAAPVPTVRVPANLVDELLRLVGETIILTGQIHERVQRAVTQSRAMQQQNAALQQLGAELEQLIDLRDMALPRRAGNGRDEFDPLELDHYNELHTVSRRLVEAATDSREMGRLVEGHLMSLTDMLADHGRLNRESQEAVLNTRMVAVKTVVPRLQRSVRQAGRAAGKRVVLECLGTDTQMDSHVIGDLVDPLMHLLRNAADHGIETEEERVERGKDPQGRIRLEFQREGNHILVRCEDDGRGLDWARIRETAEKRGVVSDGQPLTEAELCRLILLPNFSTRDHATQLSGRGIGLDAVRSRLARLGGSLNVHSETGRGCRFEFRLPLTLVSTHALLVRVRSRVLAVSNRGVVQILHSRDGELVAGGETPSFSVGDERYPAVTLATLLGLGADRRGGTRESSPVLIVESDAGRQAVRVDAVLEGRDVVVKGLGRYIPRLDGVAGATILGDGSVTPVLDLPELLRSVQPSRFDESALLPEDDESTRDGISVGLPYALVVDDSLSARRSLAQFIGDSGFEVRTARDGIEAIDLINARRPDVVLVDLEMPRMNGLELTSHIRANSETRALPVVMVTSRSTEKHRRQAEAAGVNQYITKPFSEDELLGCVETLCRSA